MERKIIHLSTKSRVIEKIKRRVLPAATVVETPAPPPPPPLTPWVRPEAVEYAVYPLDPDDDDDEPDEPYQEELGLQGERNWGEGLKVIYNGGPGKCALVVTRTVNNEECILIRRNGRDGRPEGFPVSVPKDHYAARWYGKQRHVERRLMALLEKHEIARREFASIIRFRFHHQSWQESGLAGAAVRQEILDARRHEEEEDERLGNDAVLVPFVEGAVNEGQVDGELLEEQPEADDREPDFYEEGEERHLFDKGDEE
jgi:hypothetical protein